MPRVMPLALMVVVTVVAARAGGLAAQTPPPPQTRDQIPVALRDPAQQPGMRRVPIGTAAISGAVTAADTGRPMANARVMLNGTALLAGVPSGVGGGAAGAAVGRGGAQMSGSFVSSSVSRTVLTDAQGQFAFQKLPAGLFTLSVSRSQFLPTTYGQKRPGGQGSAIQLVDGQQMRVGLQMFRGGVITGLVVSEDGEPQAFAQVRAWRYVMSNGVKRPQQTGGASTDDRGLYRLFGLQPGDYIVSATPNMSDASMSERVMAESRAIEQAIASGAIQPPAAPGLPATVTIPMPQPQQGPVEPPPGYLPTYYPGTLAPSQASSVRVGANEERADVNIQVLLAQAGSISGSVMIPMSSGVAVQVALLSDDPTMAMSLPSTRTGPDGRFTFRNIAPGQYTLFALTVPAPPTMTVVNGVPTPQPPGPPPRLDDSQKMWGRLAVSVEAQSPINVSIPLQAGRSISGVLLFDMARPPDLTRSSVMVTLVNAPSAQPVNFAPLQAQVGPDGRFTLNGMVPGRYSLRSGGGAMKSALVGGQDILDFPLEVNGERDVTDAVLTVTDKTQELTGVLTDASSKPAVEYTIVAAAADTRFWTPGSRRIASVRPDTSGRYTFRGLPPGDYLLATVTDLEPGTEFDPEFLKTLAGASVRITLAEGVKHSQDLRISR